MLRIMNSILFVWLFVGSAWGAGAASYSYAEGDKGPSTWAKNFDMCNPDLNERQSPVDISKSRMVHDNDLKPLIFKHYDETPQTDFKLENNGHTIVVTGFDKIDSVTGGNLINKYSLHSFHSHHGNKTVKGSEHSIFGKKSGAELHLVHYNNKYGSFDKAYTNPDGLLVVGIMLDDSAAADNPGYKFLDNYPAIKYKTNTKTIKGFPLGGLLPKEKDYFFYHGGLTTPPCSASVMWYVFNQPAAISTKQMNNFYALMFTKKDDAHPVAMLNNFRPAQSFGTRVIFTSKPIGGVADLGSTTCGSFRTCFNCKILLLFLLVAMMHF